MKYLTICTLVAAAAGAILPRAAIAHGFEGDTFFPPTITADDPFSKDEFAVAITSFHQPAETGGILTRETDLGFGFNKEIFPKFALGISGAWSYQKTPGTDSVNAFQDFVVSTKYQLWENPEHRFILSIGGYWNVGGSGGRSIGVDSFSTFTPSIFLGKGMGDLPDSFNYLKPIVLTSVIGEVLPTKAAAPNSLSYAFAFEYNVGYLEQHVRDFGIPHPFRDMIPLVEVALDSPQNRGGGASTGMINPGILYENPLFQIGAEAVIPINHQSGPDVGFLVNVNIFIDDLMPKLFGHPLFGGHEPAIVSPGKSPK